MSRFRVVTIWVAVALIVFGLFVAWLNRPVDTASDYGATFSIIYAEQLGLDWQAVYLAMIEDLEVENMRVPLYWSEIERDQDQYDWDDWDWMMQVAEQHEINVTLVIGSKVPRWPECYIPDWAERTNRLQQRGALTEFIELAVQRYDHSPALQRWQVENEPFFPFGECPTPQPDLVFDEIELVRSLSDKPIQMTVSGEMETWIDAATVADVVGISMYRVTWNQLFGYFYYPVTPGFYRLHAWFISPLVDQIIVSELQAEPWFPEPITERTADEWYRAFNAEMLQQNIDFAQRAGFSEVYLWGVEWWYYLNEHGRPELWEAGREIF